MVDNAVEMEDMRDVDDETDVNEPLINGSDVNPARQPAQDGRIRIPLHKAGRVVWLLTLSAGISGLLFGYDTGVISSTLVSVGDDLSHRPLTTTDQSLITAITSLFALFSSPTTGYLADRYGRRFVILAANLLFIFGAVVQAVSGEVSVMVIGRAAVGAAVGLSSCATPLYITELAPAEMRGRLVTIQSLFITGGQVVAYLVGWGFAHLSHGWRWMVGLGAVPALVQLVLLAGMFETPRWLVKVGKLEKARTVLHKLYGGLDERNRQNAVESVTSDIQAEIAEESKLVNGHVTGPGESSLASPSFVTTARRLFQVPGNRRALAIACILQGTQQLCGFNSLMYFSATIFAMVGFRSPIGTSLSVALTNFIFTIVAFAFIDSIGRRRILLCSIPFMAVGLAVCSVAFFFIDFGDGVFAVNSIWWPGILLVSMIFYVAAYAIGLGCVPWQQSELFPLRVRSLGSGIATATNWSSNFIIGISFLPMMELMSPTWTFAVYALVCLLGWLCISKIYPETAGLELEDIGTLLKDGWGVEKSVENFRARNKNARNNIPNGY